MSLRLALPALLLCMIGCGVRQGDFDTVRAAYRPSEAYLLDREGRLVHVNRVEFRERRFEWTSLDEMSPLLPAMVVAAEDRRFYTHRGIDWWALGAAVRDSVASGTRRGGSTLTMQVAALLDPSLVPSGHRRSLPQKIRQLTAAVALERAWTKHQLLEAYLNLVHFRGDIVGIAATSSLLLGKHPSGIDAVDAALIAALLPSPNADTKHLARRACGIAARASRAKPPHAYRVDCKPFAAAAERITQRLERPSDVPAFAPEIARRLLRTPGERTVTTLDLDVQRLTHSALASQLRTLAARNVRDGAAIVLDNAGAVIAWVGSAGPFSTARQVDGVRAIRQAGSTLKPFLYGIAFDRRVLTPASILDDSPLAIDTGSGLYVPQNYAHDFKGRVSARTALAASLNVPAVRTLVLVGLERFRDTLRAFGYDSVVEDGAFYGYSLALGSADVSLLEQANAYRALANGGVWSPAYVEPHQATNRASTERRSVMSPAAAYLVGAVLSDRASRAPTFGLDNALSTRYWSAVKTGTSKDMRDNWCIGYSSRYTVGVWVGNFEGDPMHDVSGVTGAAPVWLSIMNALHRGGAGAHPPPPSGVVAQAVRFDPPIESPRVEWFLSGTELATLSALDPARRPELTSPPDGAILALDPDIPADRQLLSVATRGAGPGQRVELDGVPLGDANSIHRILPAPGRHALHLLDADARLLDRVTFLVRGVSSH